ncbi:MAG: alpha1 protein [Huanggang Rhabd tick virus 2]|uniref:Alpha1 protein n=1 Tax=Huanggang Rhabd tick virus 2 TaxID=2972329 RepID=A0A9E8AA92_9RHAB|nr:MAG: alpha1 protein [Huanggang Rhabd tick virus 2]
MDKSPFLKPFEEIKTWLSESRDKISQWWGLTEWRLRLGFYIIVSLIIGIILSRILIKVFKCISKGVSGVKKLRRVIKRRRKAQCKTKIKIKGKNKLSKFEKLGNTSI